MSYAGARPDTVYFIRAVGADGPVKIGVTYRHRLRLEEIQAWCPVKLEIVATIPGDRKLETNLHQVFADSHSHGEWFNITPKLQAFLDAIVSGVPAADAIDLSARTGSIKSKQRIEARNAKWDAERSTAPTSGAVA